MHYNLEINFTPDGTEKKVRDLVGVFSGLVRGLSSSSDVVFIPKEDILSFEDFQKQEMVPVSFDPNKIDSADKPLSPEQLKERENMKIALKKRQDNRAILA